MTAEAKAAVMQLMGETYGQQRKQDQMIVGSATNLKPKSDEMKQLVEQLVKSPTAPGKEPRKHYPSDGSEPQQPQAAPAPAPVSAPAPVTPEQALAELQQAPTEAPRENPVAARFHQDTVDAITAPVTPPLEINAFAPVTEEQLGFDFSEPSQGDQLLAAIKENTLLLKAIKLQLDTSNVRPKRKSAKDKIAG